jgi:hypothetical protein
VFAININGTGNIAVKINNIPPGIYLARIVNKEMIKQIKFVKE